MSCSCNSSMDCSALEGCINDNNEDLFNAWVDGFKGLGGMFAGGVVVAGSVLAEPPTVGTSTAGVVAGLVVYGVGYTSVLQALNNGGNASSAQSACCAFWKQKDC